MEKKDLINKLKKLLDSKPKRYLIGISGIPGSGKTTLATQFVEELNQYYIEQGYSKGPCIAVPMDGFHLPKAQLSPEQMARRGAHFTFDVEGLVDCIKRLKTPILQTAPSFDHAVGDPLQDAIIIEPHHQIVFVEGIYLHLNSPHPWDIIPTLFDEKWFIPISVEEAKYRLAKRHVESHLANSIEEGLLRFETNDKLNTEFILKNRVILDVLNIQ